MSGKTRMAMATLERLLLVFVVIVSCARGCSLVELHDVRLPDNEVDASPIKTRGLRNQARWVSYDWRFPSVQRYRKKYSQVYYRHGSGGKGKGGAKGKSKRSTTFTNLEEYDDGYLVDNSVVAYNGYDMSFCVQYPVTYSGRGSSSDSNSRDDNRIRGRELRGNDRVLSSKSKTRLGGGGKGKDGGYHGYGPQDYYGNGFGYGFEYGPDGYLRPRCPPGYAYYDQIPDADHPIRPSGPLASDDSVPTQTPVTPGPTEGGPITPDMPGSATDGPAGPETPAPVTPAPGTPAPDTPGPATAAPDTPAPAVESSAPTPATAASGAPTAAVAMEAGRVTVEDSFLEYGFFDGTTITEPTQEEVDGVVEQTNLFYTEVFSAIYGADFVSFSAENNVMAFNGAEADYPVTIDFNAAVQFAEGATVPTRDEIFAAMQNADLNNYIQSYVWNSTPVMESLFYDTQRVRYDARIQG